MVEHILLDFSGGYGKLLDSNEMKKYLRLLQYPEMNYVVAGGLSTDNLDSIKPLMEEYPNLSIDAEGRLRNEDDTLNIHAVREYLQRAFQLFP